MKNLYKKEKFIDSKNISNYSPQTPLTTIIPLVDIIAAETNLTFNKNNNKNKRNSEIYERLYYNPGDIGPGRGFGNLNVSNEIRQGEQTRTETKEFKQKKEAEQMDHHHHEGDGECLGDSEHHTSMLEGMWKQTRNFHGVKH